MSSEDDWGDVEPKLTSYLHSKLNTEAARLQLRQDRACMPEGRYFEGIRALFGRDVRYKELADKAALRADLARI